jgi:hypothetical protein
MSNSVNYANPDSGPTFYIDPDPTLKLSQVNDLKFYHASVNNGTAARFFKHFKEICR